MSDLNESAQPGGTSRWPSTMRHARPSVRRAMALDSSHQEPGAELAPRARLSATAGAAAPAETEYGAARATSEATPATAPEPSVSTTPSTVTDSSAAPFVGGAARTADDGALTREGVRTSESRQEDGEAAAMRGLSAADIRGTAISVSSPADDAGHDTDTAASFHRPRKALLAAAAIAGTILIAVPLLALGGTDDKDQKKAAAEAGTTDLSDSSAPLTLYSPSASADGKPSDVSSGSPDKKKKADTEKKAKDGGTQRVEGLSAKGGATKDGAKSGGTTSATAQKEAKTAKPSAASTVSAATTLANSYSHISHVLIRNDATGMCVDLPDYGKGKVDGPVGQSTCNSNSDDNQHFSLEVKYRSKGPEGAHLFQIRNDVDNYCLDLPDYSGVSATSKVTEYPCNGTTGDNQLWWLESKGNGRFFIRNYAASGLCLDVTGTVADSGIDTQLSVFYCSTADDHEWYFVS